MEQPFSIPTSDGFRIYGVLHRPAQTTESAVVLVHGLTGHMHEFLHIVFARYLTNRGLAVLRFNQYDDLEGARRFHETTIHLHAADTQAVMAHARSSGFNRLALIGHSLGAPVSIAAADAQTAALILWDPTASVSERIRDWETYDSAHDIAYLDWRMRIILGRAWIEDAKNFPDSFKQLSTLKMPVQIIGAELGGKLEYCERYRAALGRDHQYAVIPGAGHTFVEEGAVEGLCTESGDWLLDRLAKD